MTADLTALPRERMDLKDKKSLVSLLSFSCASGLILVPGREKVLPAVIGSHFNPRWFCSCLLLLRTHGFIFYDSVLLVLRLAPSLRADSQGGSRRTRGRKKMKKWIEWKEKLKFCLTWQLLNFCPLLSRTHARMLPVSQSV